MWLDFVMAIDELKENYVPRFEERIWYMWVIHIIEKKFFYLFIFIYLFNSRSIRIVKNGGGLGVNQIILSVKIHILT